MENTDLSTPHKRWITRLTRTWPEGVPARQQEPGERLLPSNVEPWPDTWRDSDQGAMQCLHCRYLRRVDGRTGELVRVSNPSITVSSFSSTGLAAIGMPNSRKSHVSQRVSFA